MGSHANQVCDRHTSITHQKLRRNTDLGRSLRVRLVPFDAFPDGLSPASRFGGVVGFHVPFLAHRVGGRLAVGVVVGRTVRRDGVDFKAELVAVGDFERD